MNSSPDKSSTSQFLDSVMAYMERRIAGYQQRGDSIFNGSIMAEELQEWLNRLRSCVPSSTASPQRILEMELQDKMLGRLRIEFKADPNDTFEEFFRRVAKPLSAIEQKLHVKLGEMGESNGRVTWIVHLAKSEDEAPWDSYQVYSDAIKGRAEYEAARLKHFLGQGPEPDIGAFAVDACNDIGESRG